MAKKRRDSERDPSTAKRVLKAGGAVLAVGAGAALFSRTGGLKHASAIIPALSDTKKIYNKAMLNKKGTAMDMYEAYTKAVGKNGEVFKETLKKKRGDIINNKQKINYRFSTGRTTNLGGKLKNIRQQANIGTPQELKRLNKRQAFLGAQQALLEDDRFKDKYTEKQIKKIAQETFAKYKEISDEKGNVSTDFLKRTIEMYGMDQDDARIMISKVAYTARQADKNSSSVVRKSLRLSKDREKVQIEDLKKQTRDNLLLNKIGKRLGIEDLDEKITGYRQATLGEVLDNLEQLGLDEKTFNETISNMVKTKGREDAHLINTMKDLKNLNVQKS